MKREYSCNFETILESNGVEFRIHLPRPSGNLEWGEG